jgi:hypothetical protein
MTADVWASFELGDPDQAAALAGHLGRMASGLDAAAAGIGDGDVSWTGAAATAFAALFAAQPRQFAAVAEACHTVAQALARHAESLSTAHALQRRAAALHQTDPAAAASLVDQAWAAATSSAQSTARTVRAAADAAPERPGLLTRLITRGVELMGEVRLGAAEAVESAARVALSVNQFRFLHDFGDAKADADAMATGTADAARHPTVLLRAVTDWDTWTSNPARAVGHLLPDAVAAVATAGAATTLRGAAIQARGRQAIEAAEAADTHRRTIMEVAGTAARQNLVDDAVTRGSQRFRPPEPWTGVGGIRLSREDAGAVQTYWFMVASRETGITRMISELAQESQGVLMGIENRLKSGESFRRKIATQQAASGKSVADLLARVNDAVRYRIVFAETRYTRGVIEASALLDRQGFHSVDVDNHWHRSTRYRGINSTWIHARSGTVVEIQFHTPDSNLASVLTHGAYEHMRRPDVAGAERRQLNQQIADVYARAPQPPGAETLSRHSMPPPSPPKPIVPPPDLATAAGAGGGAASAGVLAVDRVRDEPVRGVR